MNRADRRRAAKCKHQHLHIKRFQDGSEHRWCEDCRTEEWTQPTQESPSV